MCVVHAGAGPKETKINLMDCICLCSEVEISGHQLFHDRASKGYGSIPDLTSQTSLHACLRRLTTMQISLRCQIKNTPMPLTSSDVGQMMARFCNFYSLQKVKI